MKKTAIIVVTVLALALFFGCQGSPKQSDAVNMKPGTYNAEAYGFNLGWTNKVTVEVSSDRILSIAFGDDCGDTPPMLDTVGKTMFPRIIEAQSIAVDTVSGATATSASARLAVQDCLEQALTAGGSNSRTALRHFQQSIQKPGGQETIGTEVLIIGMGGAGTYAGLRAAEMGAQVLIIEKQARYGGTTALTSEIGVINPPRIQQQHNGGQNYTDSNAMYNAWTTYVEGDAKQEMIDLYFAESGKSLDWLAIDHGILFDFNAKVGFTPADVYRIKFQWYPNTNPLIPGGMFGANKSEIAANFDKLVGEFEKLGGKYMLETEGYSLIRDASGAITGAKARNLVTGKEYTINAKAVVLATGGFLGSGEMTTQYLSNQYYPLKGRWNIYGTTGNDGKMLQAAIDNGAATYNIGMPPEVHMSGSAMMIPSNAGFVNHEIPGEIGAFSGVQRVWSVADIPMFLGISPNSLAVGGDGRRFTAETGVAMLDPWIADPTFYSIWSTEQLNGIRDSGLKFNVDGVAAAFLGRLGPIPHGIPLNDAYSALDKAIEMGFVFKSDTIEGLASLIRVPPGNLANTVSNYNRFCQTRTDTEFRKSAEFLDPIGAGPYYGIRMASYAYNTVGGLDINTRMQALDRSGRVIPGLFVVGSDSAGVLFSEKKPYVTFGGINNGWSLTSGKLGGEAAAEYVKR